MCRVKHGRTSIAFASKELANSNLSDGFTHSTLEHKPFGIELGFITDKLPESYAQALQYGAIVVQEPKQKPWGQTVAYLRDIDGFLIELCTPI